MQQDGDLCGIYDSFAPLITSFHTVYIDWIPGHQKILGNEKADLAARNSRNKPLEPWRWTDVNFGLGQLTRARDLLRSEWLDFHQNDGHDYYNRSPKPPRHLKGLSRIAQYGLLRLRSGTDVKGHDTCAGGTERFHIIECSRYMAKRPHRSKLFDDKFVCQWQEWWQHHDYLGFGIPRAHSSLGNVQVVAGNPFNSTIPVIGEDGQRVIQALQWGCGHCGETHSVGSKCLLPVIRLQFPRDTDRYFLRVAMEWHTYTQPHRNTLMLKWFSQNSGDGMVTYGCERRFNMVRSLHQHLRIRAGGKCFGTIRDQFVDWLGGMR